MDNPWNDDLLNDPEYMRINETLTSSMEKIVSEMTQEYLKQYQELSPSKAKEFAVNLMVLKAIEIQKENASGSFESMIIYHFLDHDNDYPSLNILRDRLLKKERFSFFKKLKDILG